MRVPGTLSTLTPLPHAPQHRMALGSPPPARCLASKTPSRRTDPDGSRNQHTSCLPFQQNEAKLDEILKELKSIKDTITNQDERISKLEQQMAKIAD